MAARISEAKVLVVDDTKENRLVLIAMLASIGVIKVEQAVDGADALKKMESFAPDLILLDIMMPKLTGFEVCRQIRSAANHAEVPILIQTALNSAADRAKSFAVGATDYITKPINAAEFCARVRIHLENHLAIRDLMDFRRRTALELDLARLAQRRLLPDEPTLARIGEESGIRVSGRYLPSSELGGDSWGICRIGRRRLCVWLCDFSGHGVGAALNSFRLHALIRRLGEAVANPATFLSALNRSLCPLLPTGQFATMLAGLVDADSDSFVYAAAASTPPLSWGQDGDIHVGDGSGLPLGLLPGAMYDNRVLPLPAGGSVFVCSDAATEAAMLGAQGRNGILGEAAVIDLVRRCRIAEAAGSGGDFLDRFERSLSATAAGPLDDDLTAILISRAGRG